MGYRFGWQQTRRPFSFPGSTKYIIANICLIFFISISFFHFGGNCCLGDRMVDAPYGSCGAWHDVVWVCETYSVYFILLWETYECLWSLLLSWAVEIREGRAGGTDKPSPSPGAQYAMSFSDAVAFGNSNWSLSEWALNGTSFFIKLKTGFQESPMAQRLFRTTQYMSYLHTHHRPNQTTYWNNSCRMPPGCIPQRRPLCPFFFG